MALTLEVGTNSYLTAVDATAFLEGRLYADSWTSADTPTKEMALVMATRSIDRQKFAGVPKSVAETDAAQALAFPRCYPAEHHLRPREPLSDHRMYGYRHYLCETEPPQAVLDATCEEALALLTRGNSDRRKLQAEGVQSYSIGKLSEQFVDGAHSRLGKLLSPEAKRLLEPYLARSVAIV